MKLRDEMFECAKSGNLDKLIALSKDNPELVSEVDAGKATVLHWAAINNQISVVDYLLSLKEIDVNERGGQLESPAVYWAVRENQIYTVEVLLDHGADPLMYANTGVNSFLLAIQCEQVAMTAFLIGRDCPVDTRFQDEQQMTGLMWLAKYRKNAHTVRTLLSLRADVTCVDKDGNTALHYAIAHNHLEIAKELVLYGANLVIRNNEGKTPLDVNVATPEMAKYIVAQSLRVRRRNKPLYQILDRHSAKILFLLPGVIIALSLVLLEHFGIVIVAGAELGIFALVSWIANACGTEYAVDKKKKVAPMSLGINLWSTGIIFIVCAKVIFPEISGYQIGIQMLAVWLMCYFFFKTYATSPGTITTTFNQRIQSIQDLVKQKPEHAIELCSTCLVQKRLRSKHSPQLGCCVAKFDHYCPFVFNVVGDRNHAVFVGFLFFAIVACSHYVHLVYQYYIARNIFFQESSYLQYISDAFSYHSTLFATACLASLHVGWISSLLLLHIYIIFRGYTTNEYLVDKFEGSPFHSRYSRGIFGNMLDTFLPKGTMGSQNLNWTMIVSHDEYLTQINNLKDV